VVGLVELAFESMALPAADTWGLELTAYTAAPGSSSADALAMLASWAATVAPDLAGHSSAPTDPLG
jgi:hypothetical protein